MLKIILIGIFRTPNGNHNHRPCTVLAGSFDYWICISVQLNYILRNIASKYKAQLLLNRNEGDDLFYLCPNLHIADATVGKGKVGD